MWLSEKTAQNDAQKRLSAEIATVSIGGQEPSVDAGGEARGLKIFSPGGYCWYPRVGQEVLVLKCGEDGEFIAGALQDADGCTLDSGEVYISAGGGSAVHIKKDGSISLIGRIYVSGELYVNGKAVGAE